jgi:hypothetical protein
MTDLEATRLCAKAMGIDAYLRAFRGTIMRYRFMHGNVEQEYSPLYNDAQAMALVKRFHLGMEGEEGCDWYVWTDTSPMVKYFDLDLNRCIVMCVAAMQLATTSNTAPSE